MTHSPDNPLTFPAARFAVVLSAVALAAAGVALAVCWALGRAAELWPACVAALVVSLVSFLVSLEPMRRGAASGLGRLAQMAMAAMGLRMVLILLGIAAVVHGLNLPQRPTALFALGFYILLMLVDVPMLVSLFNRAGAEAHARARRQTDHAHDQGVGPTDATEVHA